MCGVQGRLPVPSDFHSAVASEDGLLRCWGEPLQGHDHKAFCHFHDTMAIVLFECVVHTVDSFSDQI